MSHLPRKKTETWLVKFGWRHRREGPDIYPEPRNSPNASSLQRTDLKCWLCSISAIKAGAQGGRFQTFDSKWAETNEDFLKHKGVGCPIEDKLSCPGLCEWIFHAVFLATVHTFSLRPFNPLLAYKGFPAGLSSEWPERSCEAQHKMLANLCSLHPSHEQLQASRERDYHDGKR